jgi:uncharacterized protein YeaO (DUF488 family)
LEVPIQSQGTTLVSVRRVFSSIHRVAYLLCHAYYGAVPTMKILLKRAYEKPDNADGFRVLVDRLWPRGKKKADLRLDMWAKDISPSTELRKWFGHDPERWHEFCKRYKAELTAADMKDDAITQVVSAAHKHSTMTLIYGAKDTEHNEAVVLLPFFKRAAAHLAKE